MRLECEKYEQHCPLVPVCLPSLFWKLFMLYQIAYQRQHCRSLIVMELDSSAITVPRLAMLSLICSFIRVKQKIPRGSGKEKRFKWAMLLILCLGSVRKVYHLSKRELIIICKDLYACTIIGTRNLCLLISSITSSSIPEIGDIRYVA